MSKSDDAELSLREYLSLVRQWKWHISGFVVCAVAVATFVAFVLPKKYEAMVLLSPVSNTGTNGLLGGLTSMASRFGGLASLAGISESATDSTKAETVAVLESEALTEQYIREKNLLPILFSDEWDSTQVKWKGGNPIPTLWEANQLFKKKIRTVTTDTKTGLVTLRILWRDPVQAAQWANDLVKMTNVYRRDKAIGESERNIAYLTAEAAKTDAIGVKQAVYSVLQAELSKSMLARGNDEYALKVIDPAVVAEKPSSPKPLYVVAGAFLVSISLSLALVFVAAALRSP